MKPTLGRLLIALGQRLTIRGTAWAQGIKREDARLWMLAHEVALAKMNPTIWPMVDALSDSIRNLADLKDQAAQPPAKEPR